MLLLTNIIKFIYLSYFIKILVHRSLKFTFISAWITITILSLIGSVFDMAKELGIGIILAILSFPLLLRIYPYYHNKPKEEGKRFFFSNFGYVALGIALGLVLISIIFNLSYEPGWFDFRDIGFAIFSYPLIMFTHFQANPDIFSKRIILYSICFLNLAIIILILDIFGAIYEKVYKSIKRIIMVNNIN